MVGHAKNETYELVFGNLLIGIGGFLMGITFNDSTLNYLMVSAIPIFMAGIILDVRVLRKFSFELSTVKQSILKQMNVINQNIDDIENTKNSVERTHSKIIETNNEIDRTQLYLDSTMSDLKKAKSELLQQKVTISLNKGNARKLKSLAVRNDIEVTEMAEKIISDYLKRR